MDHLPTPLSVSGPPIEIPFVADISWDFLDFTSFPARHGFATSRSGQLLLDEISEERLAFLLQSWLYFGFLSETLGAKVRKDDFCRMQPASSTKAAVPILDSTSLGRLRKSRKFARNFKQLYYVRQICMHVARDPIGLSRPIPEVLLSIEILCNTFEWLSRDPIYESSLSRGSILGSENLLTRRMINAGWCRALVTHISKEFDIITLYFISEIQPPRVPWINHKQCSDFYCIANHVRKATYQNRHVTEHCPCKLIGIEGESRENMITIIKGGGVPLIKIEKIPDGSVKLKVAEFKPGVSYIAISHVWSDGLGNPHSNALPLCQLQKLARILERRPSKDSKSSELFWMDTLCIPPADCDDPEYPLRLDCIDRMALIYASAWSVIVLDYGLQQVRLSTCSYEEVFVHLVCCAWNQRCWTLQEGALGYRTFFQLADGIIDPDIAV